MRYETTIVGPSHAAAVAELHEATVGGGWSVASVERLLSLPGAFGVLAQAPDAKMPQGFALVLPAGAAVDLAAIGVMATERRRGCGRALIAAVLSHAARHSADKCLLEVAADNDEAIALYLTCGFEQYGTRTGYYQRTDGLRVDAHLFVRPVGDRGLGL